MPPEAPEGILSNHRVLCFLWAEPLTLDVEYTEVEVNSLEPHEGKRHHSSDSPHFALSLGVDAQGKVGCDPGTRG